LGQLHNRQDGLSALFFSGFLLFIVRAAGTGVALSSTDMNPTDKKTAVLAASEESQDTEAILLERLKNSSNTNEYFRWMLFVVGFYRGINNIDAATDLLEGFIKAGKDAEQTAHCYLALGQIATDEQRLEDALKCFTLALEHAPKRKKVAYVLHNNIGFCLNSLERYGEGEAYCREAIEIDWMRASGYRNLGISLQGQGNSRAAAWALVEAVRADPADERARTILQKLITLKPTLIIDCPWAVEALMLESTLNPDLPLN
jgi:tetratricopeptide (TPR) repeat protein